MNEEILQSLIAKWGVKQTHQMLMQLTVTNNYFKKNFFKKSEGVYVENLVIPIMRGDSEIIKAIPSGGNRVHSAKDKIENISLHLKRFALEDNINVSSMKHLATFDKSEERDQAFATLIGRSSLKMKNNIEATKEYMRLGAILGKVLDGDGNELFKFESDDEPLELKNTTNPEELFEEYEDSLVDEFGYVTKYMMMTDRKLFNSIYQYAVDNKLVTSMQVKKVVIDGATCIDYNGRIIRTISAKAKDKDNKVFDLMSENSGILLPVETDNYKEFHTHAEHLGALSGIPNEYFAKVTEAWNGSGVNIVAESVCLPINTRPYAVRKVIKV